jgi:xylan 1,4-beta-xylosidase
MPKITRRNALKLFGAGAAGTPLLARADTATDCNQTAARPEWSRGIEGQRIADLGNGTFINPIVPGDRPDPTILKDGDDYYMTFTSFESYPGLVIWHSTDLVNWTPIKAALTQPIGNVFAVDLCKHEGRYYIYIPALQEGKGFSIHAIWADDIEGPWSDPVDLGIGGYIDPGHIVGEDGKRYLFVSGILKIRLTDDGLAADGELEPAYEPWRYPDDWVVENFTPEGPKLLRRGEWFYLVTAVGGTAGPPTGHMVIAARSRSVHGPWEHCPHNPLVRTTSASEAWWSRGHATLVEGPGGDWWMVYHGYENGYRTLGRQTLLEPIEWTDDGWFRALGGDLSRPMPKPQGGRHGPAGFALSDDFSSDRTGLQWAFHEPGPDEMSRVRYAADGLHLDAAGSTPTDSSPLTCIVPDRSYEAEVTIDLEGEAEGGLLLFYNHDAYTGIGFTAQDVRTYRYGREQSWARVATGTTSVRVRVTNDEHIVTFHYSHDGGRNWTLHEYRAEVSGMHHNVFGGFLSLRIGIYGTGSGRVRLRNFTYRAIGS